MKFWLGVITLAAAALLTGEATAACRVRGNFNLTSPGPWQQWIITDAAGCQNRGFTAGGTIVFRRLYIEKQATNGHVELRQGGRYSYKPRPGFKGRDNFVLEVCGEQFGQAGCALLSFDVDVE